MVVGHHMQVLQMTSNHLALVLAAASPASTQLPHTWIPQVASGLWAKIQYFTGYKTAISGEPATQRYLEVGYMTLTYPQLPK